MAPEILWHQTYDGLKLDVWSLGSFVQYGDREFAICGGQLWENEEGNTEWEVLCTMLYVNRRSKTF